MRLDSLPFGVAHHMALVPLLVVGGLRVAGRKRDVAWWWLAGVFAVSWIADTAAHWMAPWLVGFLYPVTQAGIVALVFLHRDEVPLLVFVLLFVAVGDALWFGVDGPDVLLRTVTWGAIVGIVADRWALGRLRTALLVTFGVGWLCWLAYAFWPGWATWSVYQLTRAVGIGLFCAACVKPVSFTLWRHT